MPMILVYEIPTDRLSIVRQVLAGIAGAKEVACATTRGDLMNKIDDAEYAACREDRERVAATTGERDMATFRRAAEDVARAAGLDVDGGDASVVAGP